MSERLKPIEPLTATELRALLLAAHPGSASGARARAVVALLGYAGLRIGEAIALRVQDVDLESGEIRVLRGKGAKQRTAALLPEGAVHIDRWMKRRKDYAGTVLLCTITAGHHHLSGQRLTPGQPLTRPYVHRLLGRLAERAGISRRVHPHGLRHTHAHELALRGALVTDIRDQLGHASLKTTSGYLDSFAPTGRIARLREAMA